MSSGPEPFWLCHECGAQMRPLRIDGVRHCASCNGEFLEILDSNVNPDPFHELPPAPPVRPRSADPESSRSPTQRPTSPQHPSQGGGGGGGGFMQSLFSNIFGSGEDDPAGSTPPQPIAQRPTSPPQFGAQGGGRSFTFQIGGGEGRVFFGSGPQANPFSPFGFPFGGQAGTGQSGAGMGTAQGQGQGLEGFFPGFPGMGMPGPRGNGPGHANRPGQPVDPQDLMRGLMEMLHQDGIIQMGQGGGGGPNMIFIGPQGRMNMGDYATSETGFNAILEQLMHAAGPQGPLPATEAVIDGLPRIKFTEESLEQSPYKDCPVCKDDFAVGDEVMKIPCGHVCHPDCLQPWLKINGSCPVCRFSLIPNDENRSSQPGPSTQPAPAPAAQSPPPSSAATGAEGGGQSTLTNILNRLWGQAGSTSGQSSPTTELRSPPIPAASSGQSGVTPNPFDRLPLAGSASSDPSGGQNADTQAQSNPQQGSGVRLETEAPSNMSSAIPDDYRERHRRREQQAHQDPPVDDLD